MMRSDLTGSDDGLHEIGACISNVWQTLHMDQIKGHILTAEQRYFGFESFVTGFG